MELELVKSVQNNRVRVLLIAIVALMAQTLLAGASLAGKAQAPRLDAFGNVLCLDGSASDEDNRHTPPPHDCCVAACLAGLSLGPAPDHYASLTRHADSDEVLAPKAPALSFDTLRQSNPGRPRATPSAHS